MVPFILDPSFDLSVTTASYSQLTCDAGRKEAGPFHQSRAIARASWTSWTCTVSPSSRSGPCVRDSPRLSSEQRCAPEGVIVRFRRIARWHFLTAAPLALGPDVRVVAPFAHRPRVLHVAADPDGPLLADAAASLLVLLAHSNPPCRTKCLRKDPRLDERGEAAAE
jgi:hypothetical protein